MIAATIAGSWRVSCGFAEEDGQARGDLGAQKSRSRALCFLSRYNGPSSWFFLVCYVARSGADSREYHVSQSQYTKRLSVDEEHGQISKPAPSQHQACQGCASFSDNSTTRPLTARDVQTAAATLARDPGLVQFGRRFAISMGSHLSSRPIVEATAIIHPSAENPPRQVPVCPALQPSEQKSHAAPSYALPRVAVACRRWRASHPVLRFHLQGFY